MKTYKKIIKEGIEEDIELLLSPHFNFEAFWIKNAIQHYDYTLQSIGYISSPMEKDMVSLNLWVDECKFKKIGNAYQLIHKKVGASLDFYPKAFRITNATKEDEFLVVQGVVPFDKNGGEFTLVFKGIKV